MARRKQGNRLKQRIGITVQLVVNEDNDLIAWWENIPPGDGQRVVKNALRAALGLPVPTPEADAITQLRADFSAAFSEVADVLNTEQQQRAELENELSRQKTITANLPILIKQIAASMSAPASADADKIAQLEQQLEAVIAWANQVNTVLQDGARPPAQQQDGAQFAPAPEVQDGLTADEQDQRARKLKRQKW